MLGTKLDFSAYIERLQNELENIDESCMERLGQALFRSWESGRQVFIFGNGGSGTTASHFAEDLGKGLLDENELRSGSSKRLRVMSLTDNIGWLLAVGNDMGFDQVFVQQLMNYANPGDMVIAISGSGNSPNVINAVEWANANNVETFGFTGYDGGKLKRIQLDGIHAELNDMGMVESIHLCVFHWVLNDVFARIHQCDRYSNLQTK
jgi:D-sedoheptulose 7-phosphate isomerase